MAATDGWEAEDAKPIAPRVSHGSTGSHAASGPMSLGRSSSRGSQGSAGSHGSTHHGDNSQGTHATKSGSGGWDDEDARPRAPASIGRLAHAVADIGIVVIAVSFAALRASLEV